MPRTSINEVVTSWCRCLQDAGLGLTPLSSVALYASFCLVSCQLSSVTLGGGWIEASICRHLHAEQSGGTIVLVLGVALLTASISWSLWLSAPHFSSVSFGLYVSPVSIPKEAGATTWTPPFLPSPLHLAGACSWHSALHPFQVSVRFPTDNQQAPAFLPSGHCCSILFGVTEWPGLHTLHLI